MKKQTKLEKRRKTVLGAVLGFGAVALLTTATATWIIAVNNTIFDGDLDVTVDTVQNNAVTLDVTIDEANKGLNLAENETALQNGDVISADGLGEHGTPDFNISLSSVKLTFGASYYDKDSDKISLNFSLEYDTEHENNLKNLVDSEGDLVGLRETSGGEGYCPFTVAYPKATEGEAAPDHWTYVDLKTTTYDLTGDATNNGDGTYTLSATNVSIEFTWGSFFGGEGGPIAYYNSIFKDGTTADASDSRSELTVLDAANVEAELNKMKAALVNGLILTVSVTKA